MSGLRELADLLLPKPGKGPVWRQWAVVTATAASPNSLTIRLSGGTATVAGVRYLASYTPTVNDVVLVDQDGTDLVVLGKLA